MEKDMKFQREQLKKLRSLEPFAYEEASIYTILLDLVEGNGLDEVYLVMNMLANDLFEEEMINNSKM